MGKGLQEQSLSAALCAQPRSRLCRLDPQSSPGSQRGPQAPARPKCTHAAPKSATAQPRRCSGFPFAHPEPEAGTAATRRCLEKGAPQAAGGWTQWRSRKQQRGTEELSPSPFHLLGHGDAPAMPPQPGEERGSTAEPPRCPRSALPGIIPAASNSEALICFPPACQSPLLERGLGNTLCGVPPAWQHSAGGRQGCPRSGDRLCGTARHLRLRPPVTEGSQHPTLVDLGLPTPKPAPAAFPSLHLPHPKAEGAGGCGGGCCHPPPPSGARANLGVPGAGRPLPVPTGKRKAQRNGELLVPSSGGELGVK